MRRRKFIKMFIIAFVYYNEVRNDWSVGASEDIQASLDSYTRVYTCFWFRNVLATSHIMLERGHPPALKDCTRVTCGIRSSQLTWRIALPNNCKMIFKKLPFSSFSSVSGIMFQFVFTLFQKYAIGLEMDTLQMTQIMPDRVCLNAPTQWSKYAGISLAIEDRKGRTVVLILPKFISMSGEFWNFEYSSIVF